MDIVVLMQRGRRVIGAVVEKALPVGTAGGGRGELDAGARRIRGARVLARVERGDLELTVTPPWHVARRCICP